MDENDYMPMLGLAAGLLQGGQRGARGFGGAFSNGLLGGLQGMQMMQQGRQDQRREKLYELQLQLQMVRAQKEAAQDAARQMAMTKAFEGMDPQKAALLQAGGPEAFASYVQNQLAPPKPPTTRTINQGGLEVTQEWNGNGWNEIGRGSRWAPPGPREDNLVAVVTPDGPRYVPESQASGMTPYNDRYESPSPISKLISERDALAPDDPRRATYDAAINKATAGNQGITIGPDGTVQIGGTVDPVTQRDAVKETRKSDLAFKTADDALAKLDERLQQTGMAVLPGAEQQETSTIYRLTINELRKLTESGALQKADLDYLQSIIQDPTSLGAAAQAVGNLVGTGSPVTGTRAQIQQARDYLANVRQRTGQVYSPSAATSGAPPAATASQPPTAGPQPPQISSDEDYEALPSGATFLDPAGKLRRKP